MNFDPSHSRTENPEANFVADGYKVVSETQANSDIWYTVVRNKNISCIEIESNSLHLKIWKSAMVPVENSASVGLKKRKS